MKTYEELLAENELLKSENHSLKSEKLESQALIQWYREQLKLSKKKIFGSSSEKTDEVYEQLNLFNEIEAEKSNTEPEPEIEAVVVEKKKKKKGHREEILKDLDTEVIEYKIDDALCPECGEQLHEMTKQIRKEIEVIPAKVKVIEHVTYIYACRNCEKNNTKTPVISAPAPKALIPKSLVSPSLMSYVMYQKFVNAMPLHRQEQDFKRNGLLLSRKILANWMIKGADLLKPMYDMMKTELLKRDVLHVDETTLEVLCEPNRMAQAKSYIWLYSTGKHDTPIVFYEYKQGRSGEYAQKFLEGFKGYLHVDGYAGYNRLEPDIKLCGCWAHVRRKFDEALKVLPKKDPQCAAAKGLVYINKLFDIEKHIDEKTIDEIYKERQKQSKPVIDAFFAWADTESYNVLPSGLTGKAIGYALNQKSKLMRFLEDGRIELSNNKAERGIKPFVIGRKNWLFCNTPRGATTSAILYSMMETAKLNNLNPMPYMTYVFEQIQLNRDECDFETLLPWSDKIPDNCKMK